MENIILYVLYIFPVTHLTLTNLTGYCAVTVGLLSSANRLQKYSIFRYEESTAICVDCIW